MRSDRGCFEYEVVVRKTVRVQGYTQDQADRNLEDLMGNIEWNPGWYDKFDTSGKMEYDVVSAKPISEENIT